MRSWFVSSLLLAALWGGPARAATVKDGMICIVRTHLACAREVLDAVEGQPGPGPRLLEAEVAFREGDFARAALAYDAVLDQVDQLDRALPGVPRLPEAEGDPVVAGLTAALDLARGSAEVHAELTETRIGDVVVAHDPGAEAVLVEEAAEAIAAARARIAPLLGGDVPGLVRVELYPDLPGFVRASGLPAEAIRTTGVVAISKWNRLLVSSPRLRGGGYPWKDTLVHEWIHLVVSHHSLDRAPIWLQEGIARHLDALWRSDRSELSVEAASLLARALRTGEWITFDQMHPSMAFLPSPEAAAQAYAQVATMIEHLRRTRGDGAIPEVLALLARGGVDAREAVAEVANGGDFARFEADWRAWLRTLDLQESAVVSMPPALGVDPTDFEADPVLALRKDLANLTRLGELLAERGHHEAALTYYARAVVEGEPPSPLLVLRRAESLAALGRPRDAIAELEANLHYYPEVSANLKALAALRLSEGQDAEALRLYRAAADLDPFDPEVHARLVALYKGAGQGERAARHARYEDLLFYRDPG